MNARYFKNMLPAAAAALLAVGMTACTKDLDVTPKDPSTNMEVNEVALYTKCYANMALAGNTGGDGDCDVDGLDGGTTGFVRQMFNANELPTDEAICAWGDTGIPAFNFGTWDASHPMTRGFYYRLYTGINFCNQYLAACDGTNEQRTAEVHFLRALYYYHLMDCFGGVPHALKINETPQYISRADLFTWIESELKEWLPKMAEATARKSTDTGYGTADQDAANLLLARMYLNAEVYTGTAHWEDAKTYSEKVINGPHKLWTQGTGKWSAYQMLFMGDNGENGASVEAVLPLYQDGITTTSYGTSFFLMASTWADDMKETYSDYGSKCWSGVRARSQFVAKFFPNGDAPENAGIDKMIEKAGDDRALLYSKDRTLVPTAATEFKQGYSIVKFRNTYSTGVAVHSDSYPDADYFLMRSAEAYLIYAEADARLNGGTTSAKGTEYINAIRSRANARQLTSYTLDNIIDERAREFYYEGFRRTDLIRFGLFTGTKYTWDWKGGSLAGTSIADYRSIYAIPADDINANPNLEGHQNPGY